MNAKIAEKEHQNATLHALSILCLLCKMMKLNGADMKIICVAALHLKALCVPFMTKIIFTIPIMAIV